ncbi:MAG TPA: putative toxin-antitoxin system toxin component, PIN family [Anaeromyxobacter sp.]|nr:putative toxin-antitoxin system toxin component, PIN family [Anaeromyxobacter sp.]
MRIVLDTNVLLAAFGTRGLCEAVLAACLEGHDLVTSEHILGEMGRHLAGKFRMADRRVREIVAFVREHSEVVEPEPVAAGACRDPDDLPVLGTAVAGRADLLVTGDADLLTIGRHGAVDVVSPRECHRRLR